MSAALAEPPIENRQASARTAPPVEIMCLEDDELWFLHLERTARRSAGIPCKCHWVSTVDEALGLLERKQIDLCLIDHNLGGETGFDLLQRLPGNVPTVPCILLTGSSDESLGDQALEKGFYDYLVKDKLDSREFRRAIRYALDRHSSEKMLRQLAFRDQLTGLYNRAAFTEHLSMMVRQQRRTRRNFGVIYIDLDRFKFINDSLGHQAGDTILVEVAARITSILRDSDVVARMGGDEFVVCCPEVPNGRVLENVADKLIAKLGAPYDIAGSQYHVGSSMGLVLSDDANLTADDLIKAADLAMYEAKSAGGNHHASHSHVLSERFDRRMEVERALIHALAEHRLTVEYQPIVNTETGEIQAMEALARWHDDVLGTVPPGEFIPVAESTGLINGVTMFVFHQAFKDMALLAGQSAFGNTRIALNLSVHLLSNPALVPAIASLMTDAGVPANRVEFEVTEGFFEADEEMIIRQVRQLKALGARISVDDFGTGYSSLSRLKNYPIDAFKIDRSFIAEIERNDIEKRLCSAIVEIGQAIDVDVIGEGVETTGQKSLLEHAGCVIHQGYLYSRPQPMTKLLDRGGLWRDAS